MVRRPKREARLYNNIENPPETAIETCHWSIRRIGYQGHHPARPEIVRPEWRHAARRSEKPPIYVSTDESTSRRVSSTGEDNF